MYMQQNIKHIDKFITSIPDLGLGHETRGGVEQVEWIINTLPPRKKLKSINRQTPKIKQ